MPKTRRKRSYSDSERAAALAALAANGGNVRRTARDLGIPRGTLERWASGTAHPEAAASAAPKKADLADALEDLAGRLLGGVTAEKIAATGAQQLLTSAGIALDKMLLLRGQATSTVDVNVRMTDEQRAERVAGLLDTWRARRAGRASVPGP